MFNFKKKNTINTDVLSILIGKNELVILGKNQRISFPVHSVDLSNHTDFIEQIIENEILNSDKTNFNTLHFYFLTNIYTLIPSELFDEKLAIPFLSSTTPLYRFDKVYYSEDSNNNLFVVFSILEDLDLFIKARTGKYSIDHMAILTLEKTRPMSKKEEIHVLMYKNQAEILCYQKKQLIDYAVIDFEKEEDLLYAIFSKSEHHNLNHKPKNFIYDASKEQKKIFSTYLKKVSFR